MLIPGVHRCLQLHPSPLKSAIAVFRSARPYLIA